MSASPKKIHQVALLLFPNAEILDFAGPVEMLSTTTYNNDLYNPEFAFSIHPIAHAPTVTTGNCLVINVEMTIEEATKRVEEFDVLVVPGGLPTPEMAKTSCPEIEFIKAFNDANPKRENGDERIQLSVCTGALLIAAAGHLKGLRATTHHSALEVLKEIDGSIDVVPTTGDGAVGRYVDGGLNSKRIRTITAGGVTCGLDAGLYVAEIKVGKEAAENVGKQCEYKWK
ncbi:uncharacterized protein KY384_008834 [Bacidia gigantensis]|uniref:uncharacterized protein n=1 Tax=Bacidia gigantensis TaxID=2732470 RepID=UPI001D039452|nr:uncharacterized protein KY384_008834 [Bacidia gigantensis]KAG8525190.1 hypothetical protein KY384_008834 [Bacidia gigantensis]